MLHWKDLVKLPEDELGRLDVTAVNLACVADLPGAEQVGHGRCLGRLDEWAGRVRQYTDRVMPQFQRDPSRYNDSEGYFRVLCMVTVLQRDLGLRYNPDKIAEHVPGSGFAAVMPEDFPTIRVKFPSRRHQALPAELERFAIFWEVVEGFLTLPLYQERHGVPARRLKVETGPVEFVVPE
jgi:hypothetical protein